MPHTDIEKLIAVALDSALSTDQRITAIHALSDFPAPKTIPTLLTLMSDDELSVRWAATEVLRKYGYEMVSPLLRALATRPAEHNFYESAHHALVRFGEPEVREILAPVLKSLSRSTATAAVPVEAMTALKKYSQLQK